MSKKIKTFQMWAIRWFECGGEKNPRPQDKGAWMLCCNKSLAAFSRINKKQVITRVRVAILSNRKARGK